MGSPYLFSTSHLTKSYLELILTCKRKINFLQWNLIRYINHTSLQSRILVYERLANIKCTQWYFCRLFVSYCSVWAFFICLICFFAIHFYFCLCVSRCACVCAHACIKRKERKGMELGRWRELGEGGSVIRI